MDDKTATAIRIMHEGADDQTKRRRAEWIAANLDAIDGLLDGTLVAVPKEGAETLRIIREAYGWTIDCDGNLSGLTAGDHGYEVLPVTFAPHDLETLGEAFKDGFFSRAMITEHLKPGGQ